MFLKNQFSIRENKTIIVNLAINYGSKNEIFYAFKKLKINLISLILKKIYIQKILNFQTY